jgi:hypothetical protein
MRAWARAKAAGEIEDKVDEERQDARRVSPVIAGKVATSRMMSGVTARDAQSDAMYAAGACVLVERKPMPPRREGSWTCRVVAELKAGRDAQS